MSRIRLGGIKVFEQRAYFCSLCRGRDVLGDICSGLAANRINMGLMTHVAGSCAGLSMTAACAKSALYFAPFIETTPGRGDCTERVLSDVCRISIFPHDQRPAVAAAAITALAEAGTMQQGLGSSPAAITIVVSSRDFQRAMEVLFDTFSFPSCASHEEWQSVGRARDSVIQEVRCAYHEDVVHTYDFNCLDGLDLWVASIASDRLRDFGRALFELGGSRFAMPFLVSNPSREEGAVSFAFCMAGEHPDRVGQVLVKYLPGLEIARSGPVALLFLHGPHFGDRYGIANALVNCLQGSDISPLAISCTVSSISLVVHGDDRDKTISALRPVFQVPDRDN